LADEKITGVSVMLLEEKMDAGPILAQARIDIEEADWPPQGLVLSQMLFTEGVNLLVEVLPDWLSGTLKPTAQDESEATYTRKFTDEDALLDLSKPRESYLKIKAFDKSPRAHFITEKGRRVVVTDAAWENGELKILKVLPEGKKEMGYEDYQRGQR
jgi:methionyl-tRNA formyltransferase